MMLKNRVPIARQRSVLLFSTLFLLNLNFTLLRSLRNTLVVADLGGGAHAIPYFELFGVLPAAGLMTWMLSTLLRRFSMRFVFLFTLAFFILFYALFALCYPVLRTWHEQAGDSHSHAKILQSCALLFYVLAELWKPALIHMLFWGLINLNLPITHAKSIYPFLMLGASLGSIVAGPTIMGLTSVRIWRWLPFSSDHWSHSFILMLLLVCAVGTATGLFFHHLSSRFGQVRDVENKDSISMKKSLQACLQTPSLRGICWIVLADYIAYSLGEVIFLEILKQKFPEPCLYCRYMGHLTFWSSTFTLISSLVFTPLCVKKCRWTTVAAVLPIVLLVIEGAFFLFLRVEVISRSWFGLKHHEWITCAMWLGSCQYCVCRALKYTFFDTAKELAFVALPQVEQIQGKLVIDGLCSRLGRGGSSALSVAFISCAGGVLASSFVAGLTAFGISLSWVIATHKLGRHVSVAIREVF